MTNGLWLFPTLILKLCFTSYFFHTSLQLTFYFNGNLLILSYPLFFFITRSQEKRLFTRKSIISIIWDGLNKLEHYFNTCLRDFTGHCTFVFKTRTRFIFLHYHSNFHQYQRTLLKRTSTHILCLSLSGLISYKLGAFQCESWQFSRRVNFMPMSSRSALNMMAIILRSILFIN